MVHLATQEISCDIPMATLTIKTHNVSGWLSDNCGTENPLSTIHISFHKNATGAENPLGHARKLVHLFAQSAVYLKCRSSRPLLIAISEIVLHVRPKPRLGIILDTRSEDPEGNTAHSSIL